jgi:hypothetical protein
MVQQTNGVKDEICTTDWAKTMEKIGPTAFGFRTNFFLTSQPDATGGPISVAIDQQAVAQVDSRGATVWTWDPVANSVDFQPMFAPQPGQTLTITYATTCY